MCFAKKIEFEFFEFEKMHTATKKINLSSIVYDLTERIIDRGCGIEDPRVRTPQIRPWVLTDFGCRVLNLHILRTSVQGDLTPPRSNNNTNTTTAQTLSSERKHSRGSDDPLTALKKGAVLLRNGDNYYSRPKTQDFQEFCPGPPGSSQNPPFGSSSPHVLGKVVGSSIPQPRSLHTGKSPCM